MAGSKQCIFAIFVFMLVPPFLSFAGDIEDQVGSHQEQVASDGEQQERNEILHQEDHGSAQDIGQDDSDEEEDDDERKGIILFLCAHLKGDYKTIKSFMNSILKGLGTPKGAATLACTYGILQGISNFMWAFNWERHTGMNADDSATLQEVGGLSAAAECLLLGALVPVMLYQWNKKHPNPNAAN